MCPRLHPHIQQDAQPKHARKYHPHHRILFHAAIACQIASGQSAGHASGKGTNQQRNSKNRGHNNAGQNGMADSIAHQRPAFHHQETRQQCGGHRNNDRDQKSVLHECELKRQNKRVYIHHFFPAACEAKCPCSACLALRFAAKSPCAGANTKAIRKINVCKTTMIAPVAPSKKKLI